ncbi:MAG: hypothetical protein AB1705_16075 [Verrucomicrobiota bacterium]
MLAALLVGCGTRSPGIVEGSSRERAVVIRGANNSQEAIAAENAWVQKRHPNSTKMDQTVVFADDKVYDVVTYRTTKGEFLDVYFDITELFQKMREQDRETNAGQR